MEKSNNFNNDKVKDNFEDFVEKYVKKGSRSEYIVSYNGNSFSIDYESYIEAQEFVRNKELSEEGIFTVLNIASENLYYLFKKYNSLDYIIEIYNENKGSKDNFMDWLGDDEYTGIVCKDGKFLSLFRGTGYQLSSNVKCHIACGSSSGMGFLNSLEYEFSGNLRIFTDYFIDSCINSSYYFHEFTESDKRFLNAFKTNQANYFNTRFKYCDEIEEVKIPNKLIFDDKGYQVYLSENSLYLVSEKKQIILSIDSDTMKNIRFENFYEYKKSDKVSSNIRTYESIIETLLIISDNFEHSSKDLRFFEAKDFTKILIDKLWEFNKWD